MSVSSDVAVTVGNAFTVKSIIAFGLGHPLTVCVSSKVRVPVGVDKSVGCVITVLVPFVYQVRVPVAALVMLSVVPLLAIVKDPRGTRHHRPE